MKKVIAIVMVFFIVLALCACKKSENSPDDSDTSTEQSYETSGSEDGQNSLEVEESVHTHEYDSGNVITAANCTEAGETEYKCTTCGETKKEVIEALGHTWNNATCTEPKKCTVCEEVEGEATGHINNGKGICSLCNQAIEHSHTYDNGTVAVAPTCREGGKKIYICSFCQNEKEEILSSLGHDYQSRITKAVTCELNGEETYTCSRCQDSYTQSIRATGHDWKDATCTEAQYCKKCGETGQDALGHEADSNGNCEHCGKVMYVDMTKLISAPTSAHFTDISSGWQLQVWLNAKNTGSKTIKYISYEVKAYNGVGDLLATRRTGTFTGPIAPGEEFKTKESFDEFQGPFHDVEKVVFSYIKIEYTDGTIQEGFYGYSTTEEYWSY